MDELADDVEDVVSDDAFGGGEVADAHLDDPAFDVGDFAALPLLDIGLHLDVLGLPVVYSSSSCRGRRPTDT